MKGTMAFGLLIGRSKVRFTFVYNYPMIHTRTRYNYQIIQDSIHEQEGRAKTVHKRQVALGARRRGPNVGNC